MFKIRPPHFSVGLLCSIFSLVVVACGSPAEQHGTPSTAIPTPTVSLEEFITQHESANWKTALANAASEHYTLYWLGLDFSVQGVRLTGPIVSDFSSDDQPSLIEVGYLPEGLIDRTSRTASLSLTELSRARWEQSGSDLVSGAARPVLVAGAAAQLYNNLGIPKRPDGGLRVIIDFGATVVVADVKVLNGAGGKDLNVLTDETAFLSVLQNLRPYPQ